MLPHTIKKLSKILSRIPNIGPKSAEKLGIWFASDGIHYAQELGIVLTHLHKTIGICDQCGYFYDSINKKCQFCSDPSRDTKKICIVEQNIDVLGIEEAGIFKGLYFILGGVISPLEGKTISDLPFESLKDQIKKYSIKEIIIALGATTEADVTSMYIKELLKNMDIKLTILARGISSGTQIHSAGKKNIADAFRTRELL